VNSRRHRRRASRAGPPLALLLAAACAAPEATPTEAGIRDSAGIRIVTSDVSAIELPQWTLGLDPVTSIGVAEGDAAHELSGVTDAVRLDDGTIAVANAGSAEIRFFDLDGRFLRRIGGSGEGPGEFGVLWRLFPLAAGELAAWDIGLRRITVFAANDSVRGTWTLGALAGRPADVPAAFSDRAFVVAPEDRYQGRDMERPRRDTLPFVLWAPGAGVLDTIGRFPGRQQFEMLMPPVQLLEDMPFGPSTRVAVHADELFVGDNDRPDVAVLNVDGRPVRIIRLIERRREVTPEDIGRFKAENIDEGWRATYLAAKRRWLEIVPFPARMPWYGPLLVDRGGDLWLGAYRTAWEERERPVDWWILGPDGALRARAATPTGLRVVQVGADWVLGIRQDEAGVEHVELWALARS